MHHHVFKGCIRCFPQLCGPGPLPWLVPNARLQDATTEKAQEGKGLAAVTFPEHFLSLEQSLHSGQAAVWLSLQQTNVWLQ